jgi:hypothetical protein
MSHVPGADGADGGHRALMFQKDQAYRKRNRLVADLAGAGAVRPRLAVGR